MFSRPRLPRPPVACVAFVVAAVLVPLAGANCDDRIIPANRCTFNSDCGPEAVCSSTGECVDGPSATDAGTGVPEVSPEAEPSTSPDVSPEVTPEDAGVLPEPDDAIACQDLAEGNAEQWGVEHPFEALAATTETDARVGSTGVRVTTTLSQPARLVYPKRRDRSVDASAYRNLVLSLKGVSSTDVFAPPVVTLEDCDGATQRMTSRTPFPSGEPWKRFAVPLEQGPHPGWDILGSVDVSRLRAIMI